MENRRYPRLYIRSKNELAKHLSHTKFPKEDVLVLINDVIKNFDNYWRDNKSQSEPEKEKYVRSAKRTPLGRLLDNINKTVLAPHDKMLPNFIFGGVKKLNHTKAVKHLLGVKRERTILKLDITHFFEQISEERVYHFFRNKCECSETGARLLAKFCCVPIGPKENPNTQKTIARGFATSSRLAIWCNLDIFLKLDQLVKKRLKGKDPRIAIYVDDIGITASRVSKAQMEKLYDEIKQLFLIDKNQGLPLNDSKKDIISHEEGMEHLGLKMYRNRLSIGGKTKSKIDRTKNKLKRSLILNQKIYIKKRRKSLINYKKYIENSTKN
ncbi:MAG: reverse transcriptase domain-containing protein [Patescibacteria group bacterium]|nr:reverse transcriptase domain-containing protein [Patescibacteria group bacterium]